MSEARDRRRSWPVRKATLKTAAGANVSDTTTAEERWGMMWELAVQAWLVAGRELPTYDRSNMPSRIIRPEA